MKLRQSLLATVAGCGLLLAVLPVATAAPALAQTAVRCPLDGCGGGGGGGGGDGNPPLTQTIGQDLTAITAFTNTGFSCTFGFPVVTTTFATRVATWTASVQCSGPVRDVSGKTEFDIWSFPEHAIPCITGCGGVLPDLGPATSLTLSGSATLSPGISYGVQSELSVIAPPGQFFVSGSVSVSDNGPFFFCAGETFRGLGTIGYYCRLNTGPFSAP